MRVGARYAGSPFFKMVGCGCEDDVEAAEPVEFAWCHPPSVMCQLLGPMRLAITLTLDGSRWLGGYALITSGSNISLPRSSSITQQLVHTSCQWSSPVR